MNQSGHDRVGSPPPVPGRLRLTPPIGLSGGAFLAFLLMAAVVFLPVWVWFFWRIEPGPDQIAILVHKTGADLPSGQIVATSANQKGIQIEVLPEGRYFRNPYSWGWEIAGVTDIPADKLGVLTRLYGDDLPAGNILATDTSKGIVKDVLRPGKYRINPWAYSVEMFSPISIKPGCVGVVTALTGRDVLTDDLPAQGKNVFLVTPEMKGVQAQVLDPGTYYLNPYMVSVVEVNLQSQRFEMSGEDSISFLTADGFDITVEGTIEYALTREKAPLLTHQVGDMEDILKKLILPKARGFSRIEGSKNPAKNYITGDTRQKFQDDLESHLQRVCKEWGVDIRSVLIRNITPPDEIASIIRDREIAVQDTKKFEQQIEQAKSKAELTKQEMLAEQSKAKVEAETAKIRAVIQANQEQAVRLTAANRELQVAKLENDAATSQAQSILLAAEAEKEVIRMRNEADAGVLAGKVTAFGNGMNVARHAFYEKIGPRIQSVLSGDGEDSVGGLFVPYIPSRKEVGQ